MYIVIFGLFILLMSSISLLKVFKYTPLRELKRNASKGDEAAAALYKVVSYGTASGWALWFVIGLSSSALFLALARVVNGLAAYLLVALSIWFSFAWLPSRKVSRISRQFAILISPVLSRILSILYPIFRPIHSLLGTPVHIHTGLYQKEDLLEIIQKQKIQKDNTIPIEELEIMEHTLLFADTLIRDVMTPRRVVHMIHADEAISTHLLDELHKYGHSRFPVYEGETQDRIIGVLYLKNLIGIRESGTVRTHMNNEVYYVHEECSLMHALNAFLQTEHHLFMVVNNFEEIVGIITIEDILEQMIGKQIVDEFDQYDSMRAVAELAAKIEHKEHAGENSQKIVE